METLSEEAAIERAMNAYRKQQERVKKYHKSHPEKMREISNNYYARLKENNPEKCEEKKERARQRYYTAKAQTDAIPLDFPSGK